MNYLPDYVSEGRSATPWRYQGHAALLTRAHCDGTKASFLGPDLGLPQADSHRAREARSSGVLGEESVLDRLCFTTSLAARASEEWDSHANSRIRESDPSQERAR
jgi:hypothetical protein